MYSNFRSGGKNMIIGITGYNGAGKTIVAEEIARLWGYTHLSARAYLNEQLYHLLGREPSRMELYEHANEIRKSEGPTGLFDRMLKTTQPNSKFVIESVRCPGEIKLLKDKGGKLIGIDAPLDLRFARAILRASGTDKKTFEQFVHEEQLEAKNTDPNMQNISECMRRADAVLQNDIDSFVDLGLKILVLKNTLGV
jgi:dephospho-CoA kinase